MKVPGFTNIAEVVMSYKLRKEEPGMAGYDKYTQIVIDELITHNITASTDIEVVKIPVTNLNTLSWPRDMVNYIRIGLVVNGRVWTFTLNPNIALTTDFECGADVREVIPSYYVGGHAGFWLPFKQFGLSGGYNSNYFRVDTRRRTITIEGALPPGNRDIYLEYEGTGVDLGGSTVIPRKLKPMLVACLAWRDIELDNNYSLGEKRSREHQFGLECDKLTNLDYRYSMSEYLDYFYLTSKQSPKR